MSVPRSRAVAAFVALASLLAAGCVTPASQLDPAEAPLDAALAQVRLLEKGGFQIEVPLHVYLLGFEPDVATALQERLTPTPIDHAPFSFVRTFPPDPSDPALPLSGEGLPGRTLPVARFVVHDLDAAFDADFLAAAPAWKVAESKVGAYDANAAEAWIAARLAEDGIVLDRANPVFVILHADELGEHGWRQTFSHGYIEPVRIFGERLPLAVFDVSAKPDPYVVRSSPLDPVVAPVFGERMDFPYNHPLAASGEETLEALELLTVHAAHYRFLKGPIYPISTKPCHHVTLVLAVHQTAATEALPGYTKAKEWVDVAGLEGAFENLTQDDVSVDLKVLTLPQDEPVLDALTRGAGSFATLDALRWYLDENFDKFVDAQEGCEEYLSLLVFGDAATVGAFGGIGTYDVKRSHRISFSLVSDLARLRTDPNAPDAIAADNPSRQWNYVNLLYSHETGHLFGQHHPQHLSDVKGELPTNPAFEAIYSVMAYQQLDRNIDFGAVDHATWVRGRVGYTVADAQALDLVGTPEFDAALARLQAGDWTGAHLALEAKVQQAAHDAEAHGRGLPHFHAGGQHAHPWG